MELARQAVAKEQLRFSRDLHDMFGYHLSVITLKCELVYRMVANDTHGARRELTEVLATTRQALADVRRVARGEAKLTLAAVLATARPMLSALEIDASFEIPADPLEEVTETALAAVVREGLSNMLRHSQATRCIISVVREGSEVRLTLSNDGSGDAGPDDDPGGAGGSGIPGMAARVGALGGRITWEHQSEGWFRLVAVLPFCIESDSATRGACPESPDGSGTLSMGSAQGR